MPESQQPVKHITSKHLKIRADVMRLADREPEVEGRKKVQTPRAVFHP